MPDAVDRNFGGNYFCITNGFNHYPSIGGNLIDDGNHVSGNSAKEQSGFRLDKL